MIDLAAISYHSRNLHNYRKPTISSILSRFSLLQLFQEWEYPSHHHRHHSIHSFLHYIIHYSLYLRFCPFLLSYPTPHFLYYGYSFFSSSSFLRQSELSTRLIFLKGSRLFFEIFFSLLFIFLFFFASVISWSLSLVRLSLDCVSLFLFFFLPLSFRFWSFFYRLPPSLPAFFIPSSLSP